MKYPDDDPVFELVIDGTYLVRGAIVRFHKVGEHMEDDSGLCCSGPIDTPLEVLPLYPEDIRHAQYGDIDLLGRPYWCYPWHVKPLTPAAKEIWADLHNPFGPFGPADGYRETYDEWIEAWKSADPSFIKDHLE